MGFNTASRNGEPFEDVIKKYTIPNQEFIHCTRELKIVPIRSFLRSMGLKKGDYYEAIGIRADEQHRANWKRAKKDNLIYPLITDIRVNRQFIRDFWDNMPFTLNLKDYEGNCDLCYKKSKRKLLTLILENPKIIDWWAKMELEYGNNEHVFFRGNTSALDLLELSKEPFQKAIDLHELDKQAPTLFDTRFDYDMDGQSNCMCGEF